MENASKALLIAGSVLIAILLIAVGVRVFNSTQGTTDQVEGTMQTTEVATFNNKFLPYIGTKSKAQVISLLNTVISNNATNQTHQVTINNVDAKTKINSVVNSTYTIKIETTDYNSNGYIKNITISGL